MASTRRGRMTASKTSLALSVMILAVPVQCFSMITPNTLPEQVVQRQLKALQKSDMKTAFKLMSPTNQALTGPWKQFTDSISEEPFDPIVGHRRADVLMTVNNEQKYLVSCFVRVWPKFKKGEDESLMQMCKEYWWELSVQDEEAGPNEDCWMVDTIMPSFETAESFMDEWLKDDDEIDGPAFLDLDEFF
jgi:hypothetical protein